MSLARQAQRAGVSEDVYRQFISAVESLANQYSAYAEDRFGDGLLAEYAAAIGSRGSASGPLSEGDMFLGGADPDLLATLQGQSSQVDLMQQQYDAAFQSLAQQYGVKTTAVDDGKIYYINPGSPLSVYGGSSQLYQDAQPVGGFGGNDIGSFYRDRRTDSPGVSDVIKNLLPTSVGDFASLAFTLGGSEVLSVWDAVDFIKSGAGSYADLQQSNSNFAANADGSSYLETPPTTIENILDRIAGIYDTVFGGEGGISIPIPGLPISIPGNMSFEDLLDVAIDVATNTGQAVQDVLDQIMGAIESAGEQPPGTTTGTETPPTAPEAPPAGDDVDEDGYPAICGLGRPRALSLGGPSSDQSAWDSLCGVSHNPDGTLKGQPGVDDDIEDPETQLPGVDPFPENETEDEVPGVTGDLNETEDDPPIPGVTTVDDPPELEPTEEQDPPGLNPWEIIAPGLAAWSLTQRDDPRETWSPSMTLMAPRASRLSTRPDYGEVTPLGLFDFQRPVPQPGQVGYDPEERREVISATERERIRRMQRQGLL